MEEMYYNVPGKGYVRVRVINGEIPKHYILESQTANQYAGYRLISKDLSLIKEAVTELNEMSNRKPLLRQSLTFFIAVTYGKCFAAANSRKIKLEKNAALKYCTQKEISLHEKFIELRNKYIAHGDSNKFEPNPVVLTKADSPKGSLFNIYDNPIFMYSFHKLNYRLLNALIDKINLFVEEKLDKTYTQLQREVSDNFNENDFEKFEFYPIPSDCLTLSKIYHNEDL